MTGGSVTRHCRFFFRIFREVVMITTVQKQRIVDMRRRGIAHSQIAESLGLSANTIKSFCRRINLPACAASMDTDNNESKDICKHCGKHLEHPPKNKPRRFCCDKCRFDWWNAQRNTFIRKAAHRLVCACCGSAFTCYDKRRKYCCHGCYITDRFDW